MPTVEELLGCERCGTTVRMVGNDPPGTFRITCDCATRTYPADRYGIGHLPPPAALAPGWQKRTVEEPAVPTGR